MELPRVVLDVGGVSVAVVASDGYLGFATDRVGELESGAEASVTMILGPVAPVPPDRSADQNMDVVEGWFEGPTVWMRIGNAVARISEAAVEIGGAIDNAVDYKSIDLMVQFGIAAAVTAPDRIMVHGAVIARADAALLIVGRSGAGKSTVATAALVNGWDLLTDDLAVARPGLGTVQGVARPPRLPAGLAGRFGIDGRVEPGGRGRIVLPAATLRTGPRRLVGLVVIEHGDAGHLERLAPGDIHAIDGSFAVPPFKPVLRRHLAPAAALVSLPTFRLSLAADEAIRVARAAELLDETLGLALLGTSGGRITPAQ